MTAASAADITLWRIGVDTPAYGAHDLTGKGAERSGGRWNRLGTPMTYVSTSRALACLETVVHLAADPLPLNRYLVRVTVPAAAWADAVDFAPEDCVGWDAQPAGLVSLDWGTTWAKARRSLLARVPSVIVPEETNVLINPTHPDIGSIKALKQRRWLYDARFAQPTKLAVKTATM